MSTFRKATKEQGRARVALMGSSGSGKTYTGLILTKALAAGGKVAVIDTERGSASKYADLFDFDVCELQKFSPMDYVQAIKSAEAEGYAAILIDSLTHAWAGTDGALEQVDKAAARNRGNSYVAWREVTPQHNAMIDAMLQSGCHLVATMRTKTEYVMEEDGKGKKVPRKIGMAPIQREGMEYEFDVTADLDLDHRLIVSKTRCPLLDRAVIDRPDEKVGQTLLAWLSDGAAPAPKPAPKAEANPPSKPSPAPKKSTAEHIATTKQPIELINMLNGWLEKKPVLKHLEDWKRIINEADDHREAADWSGAGAEELVKAIGVISKQIVALDLNKEADEAFNK